MPTDLKRNYQIARRVEAMIDAWDLDTPDRPHVDDEVWEAATAWLDAEEKGDLMRFDMVVVLETVTSSALDTGRYMYRAVLEQDAPGVRGCRHLVETSSLRFAKIESICLHKRNCVGKG